MPTWPAAGNWPLAGAWPVAGAWPGGGNWPAGAAAFNGSWASLFPGAYQVVQADLGLTYGATPFATAGNTSTTVLTLSGALATTPVPILFKATNTLAIGAGATFNVYYDGLGVTPAMTAVTPSIGVPVALTGAATGLSSTWAAGASVTNDTWSATCAALADQTANGNNYSQATASKQSIIGLDASGNLELVFARTRSCSFTSALAIAAPGTAKFSVWSVWRQDTWNTNDVPFAFSAGSGVTQQGVTPQIGVFNGAASPSNGGAVLGSWIETEIEMQNTAADSVKLGLTTVTGVVGNLAVAGAQIATLAGGRFADMRLRALVYAPGTPNWAAIRAAVPLKYGVGNVVV